MKEPSVNQGFDERKIVSSSFWEIFWSQKTCLITLSGWLIVSLLVVRASNGLYCLALDLDNTVRNVRIRQRWELTVRLNANGVG